MPFLQKPFYAFAGVTIDQKGTTDYIFFYGLIQSFGNQHEITVPLLTFKAIRVLLGRE